MFVYLDETLQLALDCVTLLGPQRGIAYGWAMTPRGMGTELAVLAGPDGDCAIEYCSFHVRPDVVPSDPQRAAVNGFTLVFELPDDPAELELTLTAGDAVLRADMRDPQLETNLLKATADRAWRITFGLMREAAGNPALAGLLRYQGRPFGAFAEWMSRLPVVRGRAEGFGQMAEVEALSAPSGEVLAMLRAAQALPAEAAVAAAVIGWMRGEPGAPPEPVLLPLADQHASRLPAALAFYGRLDPALLDRLQSLELILHAEPREGEEIWMRFHAASASIPDLLDAACRGLARNLILPLEAAESVGLDLLRQVIARREAAFVPTLSALAPPTATEGGRLPRLALILGADDPAAARLFHITAAEFERRCDTVLVMGAAADDVAQVFARRGRISVQVGVEAVAALREAAGRAGILAIDAAAFATAVAEDRTEEVFAQPLEAADVARLLALHAVAGCSPALADSLQRLLRARRGGAGRFTALSRPWGNRYAAELVNAHLQRLWAAGTPISRQEPALHG